MTPAFAAFAAKMRADGLPDVVIDTFAHYYERLRAGVAGKVSRAEMDDVGDVPDAASLTGYRAAGAEALSRAVVVKLNGGLGTSMGMTRAKSILPAKDGLSFLDIIVRQTLHLRRVRGCPPPPAPLNTLPTPGDPRRPPARHSADRPARPRRLRP